MRLAVPDPDYEDPKEVYAFFGLAFYAAQVCERGVVNLAVGLHAGRVPGITRAMVLDLFRRHEGQTFGRVLRAARQAMGVPAELDVEMDRVLRLRNDLAHTFFADRAQSLLSHQGRCAAIDELRNMVAFIHGVDVRMDEVVMNAWRKLGMTQAIVDAQLREWMDLAQRQA